MAQALTTILGMQFRSWLSAKGFAIVVTAALFPMFLTAAWAGTHQADLVARSLEWAPADPTDGDNVTLTATFANEGGTAILTPFNITIAVGSVQGNSLLPEAQNTTTIEGLAAGAVRTHSFTFAARAGLKAAVLIVDSDQTEAVGEREEANNQRVRPFLVKHKVPLATDAPNATGSFGGDANATALADLRVSDLTWDEASLRARSPVTVTATFVNDGPTALDNATAVVRVGRAFGTSFFSQRDTTQGVSLPPGGSTTLSVIWDATEGAFWAEAYLQPQGEVRDPATGNNRLVEPLVVQPQVPAEFQEPTPPERATIKQFYLDIFSLLQLRFIVPLIALFYAAGVIADEREAGNLVYVLTRPVPRWTLPVAKFLAGYAVAALALIAGLIGTFLLLFGTEVSGDIGFLTTPLIASLIGLFAYGALFLILGVYVQRPYLIGLAFILGWETIAGLFVPWVNGLTLRHYLAQMVCVPATDGAGCAEGWRFTEGLQWLPAGPTSMGALQLMIVAGAVLLIVAAYAAKQREYDV